MSDIGFSKLTYSESTWPLTRREVTIIPAGREVICESGDENGSEYMDHRCADGEWRKLEGLLAACDFPAWRGEYYRPVLDGVHWHLELRERDGEVRAFDGMNDYPAKWEDFMAMCEYCEEISEIEREQQQ